MGVTIRVMGVIHLLTKSPKGELHRIRSTQGLLGFRGLGLTFEG